MDSARQKEFFRAYIIQNAMGVYQIDEEEIRTD